MLTKQDRDWIAKMLWLTAFVIIRLVNSRYPYPITDEIKQAFVDIANKY